MYNTSEKVRDIVSLSLLGAEMGVQSAPTQQECPALWLERKGVREYWSRSWNEQLYKTDPTNHLY